MHSLSASVTLSILITSFCSSISAQNLIRNGSFEDAKPYTSKVLWSMTKKSFDENMKFWKSPSGATPDIILDEYRGRPSFERTGLDLTPCLPRTGSAVVAIRSFGCKSGILHCREYLQSKTKVPLKKGCTYEYEFYAQPAVTSVRINNLGIAFTEYGTNDLTNDKMLKSDNVQAHKDIIFSKIGEWVKISGEYTMDKNYNYILLGNFFNDDDTKDRKIKGGMKAAYYLIDDVSLKFKSCPNGISPPPMVHHTITLDNILFDNDSATLRSSLDSTYQQIINQDYYKIQIIGYTDDSGTAAYNTDLSLKRANAVRQALHELGIPLDKMTSSGLGSSNPISTTNKQLNRRVVVIIE